MKLNEKEITELSDKIIEACFNLLIGKEPSLLSGEVFKLVGKHARQSEIIQLFKDFIMKSDMTVTNSALLQELAAIRYKMVEVYLAK